jgi:predicted component of type VI protein secretion system
MRAGVAILESSSSVFLIYKLLPLVALAVGQQSNREQWPLAPVRSRARPSFDRHCRQAGGLPQRLSEKLAAVRAAGGVGTLEGNNQLMHEVRSSALSL